MFKVNVRSFSAFRFFGNLACRKTLVVEQNGVIWVSGISIWSVLKVNLRLFAAFPIFNNLFSVKRLVVEQRGLKLGPMWQIFFVYKGRLTVKWLKSVWGFSVDIRYFYNLVHVSLCISKKTYRSNMV